ncbi:MAG: helix-turn-helix domain-containing protein [Alphaproteobacteria bacterium]|uniref:Helix-turn-helix domain-containing protein n=1 Tax=Candidatus Nitrobium versatile TaxID=2884831 RepID=A0A953SF38_9BACT|nr:helix-turn-helix domain-containing protein [Candidatus Nitrobium versatile]
MPDIKLKSHQRRHLQQILHSTHDVHLYRRILAIVESDRGKSVASVAHMLGVSRQSIYNWIDAYEKGHTSQALVDAYRSGRPRLCSEDTEALIKALLSYSPERFGYVSNNWTVPLLKEQLHQCTGQLLSDETLRRALRHAGYVWKRPRYVLAPDPEGEKKRRIMQKNQKVAHTQCASGGR